MVVMESSPRENGGGDNFIGPWGTLNFHVPLGGLAKWATAFSLLGGWGESLIPLAKDLLIPPPPAKVLTSSLPPPKKNLFPPPKAHPPPPTK